MADGARFTGGLSATPPRGWRNKLMASPRFQAFAARFPLTRGFVRREGQAIFDIIAGFCHSQILMALAELKVPEALLSGPVPVEDLAQQTAIPQDRLEILVRAGAAIDLLTLRRGTVSLTSRGAVFATVPGLSAMVRHHRAFYRDLEDPVAFFRGETTTELASVWPYVFGSGTDIDGATAQAYSDLMAQSQILVAQDTLRMVSFDGIGMLMDVGGGTGAFLEAVGRAHPDISLQLFDLPAVAPGAQDRFVSAGLVDRAEIVTGSFKEDALPDDADAISLIRVLYDHSDTTVADLLAKAFAALPPGGRIIISEPMSGGARPDKAADAYFALYTLAMQTGRTRSAEEISTMLAQAGFTTITAERPLRSFITAVVTAKKPN